MKTSSAIALLENLIERATLQASVAHSQSALLTPSETEALRIAIEALVQSNGTTAEADTPKATVRTAATAGSLAPILNLSALDYKTPILDYHLCLDFGTATSKAALIAERDGAGAKTIIEVLPLGAAGEQQEVSESLLISSVYIADNGNLLFGLSAQNAAVREHPNGDRQRIDNIKRFFSEEGLDETVPAPLNPTGEPATFRDLILAYLTFFVYTVNECINKLGLEPNVERRFALPCFQEPKATLVAKMLRSMLGQAQVLADTFGKSLTSGIPLKNFLSAVRQLPSEASSWSMITDPLTEPMGVANILFDEHADINGFILVVDVGAGTSDMGLFRIVKRETDSHAQAWEAPRSARGIEQAGNYLDRLLKGYAIQKSGIAHDDERYRSVSGRIELDIRLQKETLFLQGHAFIATSDEDGVDISLDEFRELEPVKEFSRALQECIEQVLGDVPSDWIEAAANKGAIRIVLTGGGATLPMVKELAQGQLVVRGHKIQFTTRDVFPDWLSEHFGHLRVDFPRTAVALGGAKKNLILSKGYANVMAGGSRGTPQLQGFYSQGS